jgi:hypothetical protein
MTDILIAEAIPDPPTWPNTRESDQGFRVVAPPNEWSWQDLPDYMASRPLSFDSVRRVLGGNWSFDAIMIPHSRWSLAFLALPDETPSQFYSADYLRTVGDVFNAMRELYMERDERLNFPVADNSTTTPADLGVHRLFSETFETHSNRKNPLLLPVHEFALGWGGVQPDHNVVEMAIRIVQVINDLTIGPYITVDEEGGELDIHLRLADGQLMMANIFPDGTIDASVYDDSHGTPVKLVKRMRRMTTSEKDLINLLRAGIYASTS